MTGRPAAAGLDGGRPSAAGLGDELLVRCRFPDPGVEVVCGVSGGADSSALAVLAVAAGCAVRIVHVDHGLRPADSERERGIVEALGRRLGVDVAVVELRLDDGPDLEGRARTARRAALGPDALLGHTADDLAETMLLHLLRGTGPEGVVAIEQSVRPLLGLRRAETVALCDSLGLDVVDDPHNRDPRLRRARVRHEVLPLLDDVAGRDVVPLLVRHAALLGDANAVLTRGSAWIDPTSASALAGAPVALARLAVRRWWREVTGEHYAPDAASVERVLAVARGETRGADVHAGWRVSRSAGRLALVRG